jgi:hypothetical protein
MSAGTDLALIRERKPLVHQITNFVVMNETANATLAIGALPVMAHALQEVEEMASVASALVLNIGTLSDEWVEAMIAAGRAANAARGARRARPGRRGGDGIPHRHVAAAARRGRDRRCARERGRDRDARRAGRRDPGRRGGRRRRRAGARARGLQPARVGRRGHRASSTTSPTGRR